MNQEEMIYDHLIKKGAITPLDALNLYGCFRLGARIFDLKQGGVDIETKTITKNGKTFAQYSLKAQ